MLILRQSLRNVTPAPQQRWTFDLGISRRAKRLPYPQFATTYLAARTDVEHFLSERAREERETEEVPEKEVAEVADVLRSYGLRADQVASVVKSICADKKRWVDFMMRFELGLEEPDPKRASRSALTIAGSYIAGGLVPLAPYFFFRSVTLH